jgi:hypothetical protein
MDLISEAMRLDCGTLCCLCESLSVVAAAEGRGGTLFLKCWFVGLERGRDSVRGSRGEGEGGGEDRESLRD